VPPFPARCRCALTRALFNTLPLPHSHSPTPPSLLPRQYYLRPSLLRQRAVSDALYHKAKNERVKLVEELVLQKNFFPW
jgi:hypothetical protein